MVISEIDKNSLFIFGKNKTYNIGDNIYKILCRISGNLFSVQRYYYYNGKFVKTQDCPFCVIGSRPITIIE